MKKYLLILLILASSNTFAALNKWVDADGKVHYSDEPPPANIKAQVIHSDSTPQPVSGVPDTSKANAGDKSNAKPPIDKSKEAADKAAQEAVQQEYKTRCVAAQQNMRTLQDGIRILEIDAKGERAYLDDAQRQQRVAKTQQDISTYCK